MTTATARDWANGYLQQARADLAGAKAVQGTEPSVFAMLLQMFFEKIAKAALLRSGAVALDWAEGSHAAASRFLEILLRQRRLLDTLGGEKVWRDSIWVVTALEQAHPQVAKHRAKAKLEYPWETVDGTIQWPARDLPIAKALGTGTLAPRILRFASRLEQTFDTLFP